MRTRITAALVFAACLSAGADAQLPASWPSVVDGYRRALQKAGIVGSSLMVVRDGRIVARQNEGLQNLERREPVTNDTIYHWASITKTFTGIAIRTGSSRTSISIVRPGPGISSRSTPTRRRRRMAREWAAGRSMPRSAN